MKKFKKLLVCMLAVMMLISSAIPVSAAARPAIPNHKECRDDQYRTYVSQLENCKQCRWIQTANLQL